MFSILLPLLIKKLEPGLLRLIGKKSKSQMYPPDFGDQGPSMNDISP
jgi:hypothetical protein